MLANSHSQPYSVPAQHTLTAQTPVQDYGPQAAGYQKSYSKNNPHNGKSNKYKGGKSKDYSNGTQPPDTPPPNYKCFISDNRVISAVRALSVKIISL